MDWQTQFPPLALASGDALPPLLLTHLTSWQAITVQGEDSKSYLQGQLTCDVVTLAQDANTLGAHCDPKGKMWSIFRLFHTEQGYALFQHASGIDTALTELKKYSVFSKVTIELDQDIALGLMGEQADSFIDSFAQGEGDVRRCPGGSAVRIEDGRWLLLINTEQAEALSRAETLTLADESLWDLADIRAGLPRITAGQQSAHIPQALNLQLLDGISFSKGCYTGQETVARARYRGSNKRAMYLLQSDSVEQIPNSAEIERAVGDNWRAAGELLCHYRFADGKLLALAVLPNNLEPDTAFRFSQQPEVRLQFAPMPYSLDSE